MDELDCTTCGACCATPPETSHLYRLGTVRPGDVIVLPRWVRRNRVVTDRKGTHLEALVDDDGGERCFALVGEVRKSATCSIYDQRPASCREFEPGSALCLRMRAEAGFPVENGLGEG